MATKKILLIRNAAQSDYGGAETYQLSLAKCLTELGHQPVIVTRSDKLLKQAAGQGFSTMRAWWWAKQDWSGANILLTPAYIGWQVLLIFWYLQLVLRTKAQVLHIQSKDDFIAGTIAGKILNRTVVWTDHMDLRYILQNLSHPLKNPVAKMVFACAFLTDSFIVISNNEKRLITEHLPRETSLNHKIRLVHNGVLDLKPSNKHVKKQPFTFCTASRLVESKGVIEAIEAFKLFMNDNKNADTRLIIYGDGQPEFKNKLYSLAEGSSEIIFAGHKSDIASHVAEADVYMLPSYQEGFSIALLEATMLGSAIIASDVDSNPEIIQNGKNGVLVKPRNINDLSAAMSKLYKDSEFRHKIKSGARKSFEEHYDLRKIVVDSILPLYSIS